MKHRITVEGRDTEWYWRVERSEYLRPYHWTDWSLVDRGFATARAIAIAEAQTVLDDDDVKTRQKALDIL